MAREVVFHPGVEDDLDVILAYYAERDPTLPRRFRARLKQQVGGLGLFPESGSILFETFRRLLLNPFPYMAVYQLGAERIDVLAIVNIRRDPAWIESMIEGRADS